MSVSLALSAPIHAAPKANDPDLAVRFLNAIPDLCFTTARGHPPTKDNAAALLLEPVVDIPATVKTHYSRATGWFRLKTAPDTIFLGVGDRANCHLVLANTTQTPEVQTKVIAFLKSGGFQLLQGSAPSAPVTDMLFAKEAPDGYMLVSLQAPREAVQDGDGDQGAVHVSLMPKAAFEALLPKR